MRTLLSLTLLSFFCLACGGGGAKSTTIVRTTTAGQELLDLERAYRESVLTENQYQEKKKSILEGGA